MALEVSPKAAGELLSALVALRGLLPPLDVPQWTTDGKPIETVKQLAQEMGIPTSIAKKVAEEKGLELKYVRHVKTPAGARRFGLPIGAVIVRDPIPYVHFGRGKRGRVHIVPRNPLHRTPGNGGGGAEGGGAGGGGLGGGIPGLSGLSGLKFSKNTLPKGSRKLASVSARFPNGSKGTAEKYVTKLRDGDVVHWLVMSLFDKDGNVRRTQLAKMTPGKEDKQWAAMIALLKSKS